MGYNHWLFEEAYNYYLNYLTNSKDKNIRLKIIKFMNAYESIISNYEWRNYEFHSIIHELKTHELLSSYGDIISGNDNKSGPDYFQNGVYFECVSVTFGKVGFEIYNKLSGEKIGVQSHTLPRKDIIFRVTTAISNKKKQYNVHLSKGIIKSTNPYIMVIDTSLIYYEYSQIYPNFQELLLPLIGVGEETIIIDRSTMKAIGTDYNRYENLQKENSAFVEMGIFLRDEYKFLSGILFTSTTLNDKYSAVNSIFVENLYSNNKLDYSLYVGMKAWTYDSDTETYSVKQF